MPSSIKDQTNVQIEAIHSQRVDEKKDKEVQGVRGYQQGEGVTDPGAQETQESDTRSWPS